MGGSVEWFFDSGEGTPFSGVRASPMGGERKHLNNRILRVCHVFGPFPPGSAFEDGDTC